MAQDEEPSAQARMVETVSFWVAAIVLVVVPVVMLVQPNTVGRGAFVIAVVVSLAAMTVAINRTGRPRLASWTFLVVAVALVTLNALPAGGIRSPGVQTYFIWVMLAGLLLGRRAGMALGVLCGVLGLGLVLLELSGRIPPTTIYGPVALWLLICVYMGVALLTMRLATGAVGEALVRAEKELAERTAAEYRLSHALEAGGIGVFELDVSRQLITADARALALTSLSAGPDGSLPFAAWRARVHPEDVERLEANIQGATPHGTRRRTRFRYLGADGTMRHLETASYVRSDPDGTTRTIVGLLIDLTEHESAERERERLLRDLGERVKELRLLHDFSDMLRGHRAVDRLVLASLAERMPAAWLHPEDCVVRITYGDTSVETPGWRDTPWKLTAAFRTSSGRGSIEVAYLTDRPALDEGPFLKEERELLDSLAELLRANIEERAAEGQRRGLEAQLRHAQKMDALGTLAGGIAHDFNNILTAIGGNAELALAELPVDAPARTSVLEISRAQARAKDLVKRILLFSRRQETERAIIRPAHVVEEALELLRASLPPSVQIRRVIAPKLPPVLADATQLHQVIMNLGTNAGYAMQATGGILTVELGTLMVEAGANAPAAELESGDHVVIRVSDTGTGMSREIRERLFEPFFTTKGSAGTGLGLAVVHGIVRDHGGAITVDSAPGQGTEFRVFLPAAAVELASAPAPRAEVQRGRGQRVMYVDDEEALAFLMARTMHALGYQCTEFTDAAAALQEFRTTPDAFDAVVTDLQMQRMSGLELLAAIRAVRPGIPTAVASGIGREHVPEAVDPSLVWIHKPSSLAELSASLASLFRTGG